MGRGTRNSSITPKAEYVSRPTFSSLFAIDIVVFTSSIIFMWAIYFLVVYEPEAESDGNGLSTVIAVLFLVTTALYVGCFAWKMRSFSEILRRGEECTARVAGFAIVRRGAAIDYEYTYHGMAYRGRSRLPGFGWVATAQRLIGQEIIILIDPDRPKRTLVLSKLR